MVVFGGNRERMREMAFGSQVLNDYEETNGHLIRQPEIEQWAKDVYGFVCREFGEEKRSLVHSPSRRNGTTCALCVRAVDRRRTPQFKGGSWRQEQN